MKNNLVNVNQINADVIIELRYASKIILQIKKFLTQMNVLFIKQLSNIYVSQLKFQKIRI